jgi:hypothetical protein
MKSAILFLLPDGRIEALYTEMIHLTTLGSIQIQRLSQVEFNPETQDWAMTDTTGTVLFRDSSRQMCLEWEQHFFNDREEERHR